MTALPSVTLPAAITGTGDFADSPQFSSAFSYVESCLSNVDVGCYSTATIIPCYCSTISNYVSSQNDCLASGNSIGGTTLWDLFTGNNIYFSALSEGCSDVYTVTPFSITSNTMLTTPRATTTPQATATPTPIFEPISISVVSSLPTTTYPTQSIWSGTGDLLVGYCASPEYTLVDAGATVWWAPVVGCHPDKPDCCPSSSTDTAVSTFTSFVASTAPTVTVTIEPSGQNSSPTSQPGDFGGENVAMAKCPADYQTVSGGCCPSGYELWNAALGHGGSTPCFSVLPSRTNPPPYFELSQVAASQTTAGTPTSAVVNIVYAVHYPVKRSSGLPHSTIIAIAVSCAVGALLIGALVFLSLCFMRRIKKRNTGIENSGSNPLTSDKASGNQVSSQQDSPATTDSMQQVKSDVQVYTQPQPTIAVANQGFQTYVSTVPQMQLAAPLSPNAVVPTQIPQPTVSPISQVGSPPPLEEMSELPPNAVVSTQIPQVAVMPFAQVGSPPSLEDMSNLVSSPVSQPQELHDPHWTGRYELQSQS